MKKTLVYLLLPALLLFHTACTQPETAPVAESEPEQTVQPADAQQAHLGPLLEGGQRVTQSQFDLLQEGMTLEEVTAIVGSGTERGFTLLDDEVQQIIGWENSDGSEINVTVMDNRVTRLQDLMLK